VILSSPDVKIHNPSLRLTHRFDEITSGSLDVGYSHFHYQYSTVENYSVTMGLSRALNELWKVSASAGERFTESKFTQVTRTYLVYPTLYFDTSQPSQSDRSFGWVGQVSLAYNGECSSGMLSLFRDVTMGRLSANERSGVSLDTAYRFTEDF
jgi:hypothetical protein